MAHTFQAIVVEVDMGYLHITWRQAVDIDAKAVVLGGDFHMTGGQIFDRLVAAAMAEFQFVGCAAVSKAKHLMTEADAENRFLAEQCSDGVNDALNAGRVTGTIGEENTIRLHGQYRFSTGMGGHHLDPATLFGQNA